MKKIFIDANILIDFIDPKRAKHNAAVDFFRTHLEDYFYTSCDILTTIYYITSKTQNPLQAIENLLKLVKIIPFGNKEAKQAIDLMNEDKKFKDFEDTIQYILAKKVKSDYIATNDKGFYSSDIEIISV
ncbi:MULTISPECIES: type II toxin-antitoxin system VapC family toxin [unclassified Lebetimonas]|uniref:type II toxin-antitoxin system VapC family toxin n=1 Tax=unclassified Lebetimonas TaxID=2648158 RepID=UPI0004655A61|nr:MULTISPECIES: PIN domain-containing protein [unclassified Lebetimonas]